MCKLPGWVAIEPPFLATGMRMLKECGYPKWPWGSHLSGLYACPVVIGYGGGALVGTVVRMPTILLSPA